ncbi:hypothetical protein PIB30_088839 [Stylosanthes scabra]|uniref:Uncharacterized protein n=1 Tax=Stylosanthes scabra TaxID=79078 RepID=A0ABU6RU26_9FABA|nr:hypothetical protein [Stylosanthes scabra]
MAISSMPSSNLNEFVSGWQLIWSTLVHALPIFSNILPLVDAALVLLSYITSNENKKEAKLFGNVESMAMLTADLRDSLHLRKNLLRAILSDLNLKGCSLLDERMVFLLPSAMYALCAGCVPPIQYSKEFPLGYSICNSSETLDDYHKLEDPKHQVLLDFLDCSIEALTKTDKVSKVEVVLHLK